VLSDGAEDVFWSGLAHFDVPMAPEATPSAAVYTYGEKPAG
jgi:hypothetical protein